MSNKSTTTEVSEEELLKKYLPTYVNAPEDLEQARDRILEVEMALEDLARAVEIAQVTNNMSMLDSFRQTAESVLQSKIEIVQPDQSDMKLNVVIDDRKDPADA
jgi:hypothetical protein